MSDNLRQDIEAAMTEVDVRDRLTRNTNKPKKPPTQPILNLIDPHRGVIARNSATAMGPPSPEVAEYMRDLGTRAQANYMRGEADNYARRDPRLMARTLRARRDLALSSWPSPHSKDLTPDAAYVANQPDVMRYEGTAKYDPVSGRVKPPKR